ncbi:MAG: DUF475 domain-containing protein [Leptolyngbya sp.]|nr:DUF475 domain-containing protein [Candidatus Melainabacteria bacterium]
MNLITGLQNSELSSVLSASAATVNAHVHAPLAVLDLTSAIEIVQNLPATVVDQVHNLLSQLSPEAIYELAKNSVIQLQSFGIDDFLAGAPIVLSLVVLEGLLSVDNAMVLAAMVRHLPKDEQQLALKAGIAGAYVGRISMLGAAAWIIGNPWVKLAGGGYLIYMMVSSLGVSEEGEGEEESHAGKGGFWATVVAVEFADLAFSVDNVAAAVAMSDKMWAVITGVMLGILAMRFVAGLFIGLIEKYPVLEKIAYLLVGWIGILLVLEEQDLFEANELTKFASISAIIAAGMLYDQVPAVNKAMKPAVTWTGELFGNIYELTSDVLAPVGAILRPVLSYAGNVAGDLWETTSHLAKPLIYLGSRPYAVGRYVRQACFSNSNSTKQISASPEDLSVVEDTAEVSSENESK